MIRALMAALDPAEEWTHLSSHYRSMTDEELLAIARQRSQLTNLAQQAIGNEIAMRGLKVEVEPPPPTFTPPEDDDSLYAEDRKPVELCKVWSIVDALQLQRLLDTAGIPFFMGPENATGVDAVTSDFTKGVTVKVMNIGLPWARQALDSYEPKNEPNPQTDEPLPEAAVLCPKCRSTEVIFLEAEPRDDSVPDVFNWVCDNCGHQWQDDGVERETGRSNVE